MSTRGTCEYLKNLFSHPVRMPLPAARTSVSLWPQRVHLAHMLQNMLLLGLRSASASKLPQRHPRRLEALYDAQEEPDETDDPDFDVANAFGEVTSSDDSEWEEVHTDDTSVSALSTRCIATRQHCRSLQHDSMQS